MYELLELGKGYRSALQLKMGDLLGACTARRLYTCDTFHISCLYRHPLDTLRLSTHVLQEKKLEGSPSALGQGKGAERAEEPSASKVSEEGLQRNSPITRDRSGDTFK